MLLHFVYVYYTCLCIAWYLLRALLGRPPENKIYGKQFYKHKQRAIRKRMALCFVL